MKPLVTIGVPVRNGERFLTRALDSHAAQTYPAIEIVVSDNESSDRTPDILADRARQDQRIRIIRQQSLIGIVENFMTVLSAARGEYFMWAADDDQWRPEFVEALVSELEAHPEAAAAMSAVDLVTEEGAPIQTIRFTGRYDPNTSSYARMLRSATTFQKLNFYLYGLYRTDVLRRAMRTFADVPGPDRLFVCQLALGVRLRQVDRVLHLRTIHRRPTHLRLPEERFNALKRDRWADLRVLRALAWSLSRSEIIPWQRKLLLPYAMWRYTRLLLLLRGGAFAKRHLPQSVWRRLRERTN